jgi:hypothetical protein
MSLRIWTDSTDWYAFEKIDNLKAWLVENAYDGHESDWEPDTWRAVADDETLTINDDDGDGKTTKTAREWLEGVRAGALICSTEY